MLQPVEMRKYAFGSSNAKPQTKLFALSDDFQSIKVMNGFPDFSFTHLNLNHTYLYIYQYYRALKPFLSTLMWFKFYLRLKNFYTVEEYFPLVLFIDCYICLKNFFECSSGELEQTNLLLVWRSLRSLGSYLGLSAQCSIELLMWLEVWIKWLWLVLTTWATIDLAGQSRVECVDSYSQLKRSDS